MDKNKSIDGLAPRRPSKTTTSSSAKKTTRTKTTKTATTKKPSTQKTTPKTTKATKSVKKSPTKKSSTKTTPTKAKTTATKSTPTVTPATTPVVTPTPQAATEDFLKPVQAFDFDEQSGQLVASKEPIKKAKKMKKEKKPKSKKRKIITRTIIVILLLLLIGGIGLILWLNGKLGNMTNDGNLFDFFSETYEPLKTDENGRTNILAFGTSGFDMEGEEYGGVHDGAQLTDSIMVLSFNQETGDVALLSLPRDLKVTSYCTSTGKINEVYWCNNMDGDNEQAGAEALMAEVGNVLGIDFQYYAHLNWGSLESIINTIGGITVVLDEDIDDYYYTGSVYEAGKEYNINGIEAVALSRARHGTASGDFSRGASQQKILIGIKNKILQQSLSISELLGLISTLGDNLRTNFSVDELKTLAHLLSEFDFNNIRQVSLIEPENYMTTGEINGISYVLPVGGANYYTDIQNYIAKMFSSDPRVYEDASILVLNASETPGLASAEQTTLKEAGYQNVSIDDTTPIEDNSKYLLYNLNDKSPGTMKLLEEKYEVKAKSAAELPANIPQGYDFILIINQSA